MDTVGPVPGTRHEDMSADGLARRHRSLHDERRLLFDRRLDDSSIWMMLVIERTDRVFSLAALIRISFA